VNPDDIRTKGVDVESLLSMIFTFRERHNIKRDFHAWAKRPRTDNDDEEHEEDKNDLMARTFKEFSDFKLHRPGDP
jgi:hypothetical protein